MYCSEAVKQEALEGGRVPGASGGADALEMEGPSDVACQGALCGDTGPLFW
eukprot:SAG11_NODE_737_length_7431_cov_7.438762_13_plen_51_part_00